MSKWLIRTYSNHLLGPVSKGKLRELMASKSLGPKDEVCSGNGYWFSLNERDLVAKFIEGEETASFNPLSEELEQETDTGFISIDSLNVESAAADFVENASVPFQEISIGEEPLNLKSHPGTASALRSVPVQNIGANLLRSKSDEFPAQPLVKIHQAPMLWKILMILVVLLGVSAFVLRDRVLEFRKDLHFFDTSFLGSAYAGPIALFDKTPVIEVKKK